MPRITNRHVVITAKIQQFWQNVFNYIISMFIVFCCGIWLGSRNIDLVKIFHAIIVLGLIITSWNPSPLMNIGFAIFYGLFHAPLFVTNWILWPSLLIQHIWGIMALFELIILITLRNPSLNDHNHHNQTVEVRTCFNTMFIMHILKTLVPHTIWYLVIVCLELIIFTRLTHLCAIQMFRSSRQAEFHNINHLCQFYGMVLFLCFVNLLTGVIQFVMTIKI